MSSSTSVQLTHAQSVSSSRLATACINQPRTIFVSDVHMGCRYGRSLDFLNFLNRYEPEYLYLVGDMLDGCRLARSWYWDETYSQIIQRLSQLADIGTSIYYTPGNHDDFLRPFLSLTSLFGKIQVADQFVHTTADDRHLVIMHGDQFDRVVGRHRAISRMGDRAYDVSMFMNRLINRVWCSFGGSPVFASKHLKQQVKRLTNRLNNFETTVINYAKSLGCSGIVCGHIHCPDIKIDPSGVVYYNTGDWVENTSAITESEDGQLGIMHWVPHT